MLTERSIINFLVWMGGLILGPYLAATAIEGNYIPLGVAAAVVFLVFTFGILKDRICLLPLICSFAACHLNFLPLKLAPTDIATYTLLAYYFVVYFALQRKKMLTGPLHFFIPLLIIFSITLYHEHSFGMRSMGNGREGGRGAVAVFAAILVYVCGVSINGVSPRFLRWTPLICVIATILNAVPYAATTFFPQTTPYFYLVTDAINGTAYSNAVLNADGIVRNQGPATVGATIMIFLVSYLPIHTWWRPRLWWWILPLSVVCVALVVLGGFRSALATFGLTMVIAIWCYYSWRTLFLIPFLGLAIFGATALQDSHAVNLPEAAQRSLAFLPGDWDQAVKDSTTSSNDFRDKIRKVYIREEARKSPLLGNGLSYNSADFQRYNYLALVNETPDGYYGTKIFVTGKMFHSGWMSLYDSVGLIGFAAFLAFTLSLIWVSGRMVFRKDADRGSPLFPLKVWMFCNILPTFVGYFTVFGDFKAALPGYCYFAILWTQLNRLEKHGYRGNVPVREVSFNPSRTEVPVSA